MLHRCTYWLLYLAAFLLLGTVAWRDFSAARWLARPTPAGVFELISSRRPLATEGGVESRKYGSIGFRVEGLAQLETSPLEPLPWRHGVLPATRLSFDPGHGPIKVSWTFRNKTAGQRLRVLLDGKPIAEHAVGLSSQSGSARIPPSASASSLELEFARAIEPGEDPRSITVTFSSLQISFR